MDIFQFAMEKENFSREYYLQLAGKTSHTGLKKICTMLADEEAKHYDIVEKMSRGISAEVADAPILDEAKRIFEKMRETADQFDFNISELDFYRKASEIEPQSRKLYLEKAEQVQDRPQKTIFKKLARQERMHEVLLKNICECILQPQTYLATAEFYHIDNDI
jgi:rubrerythrin